MKSVHARGLLVILVIEAFARVDVCGRSVHARRLFEALGNMQMGAAPLSWLLAPSLPYPKLDRVCLSCTNEQDRRDYCSHEVFDGLCLVVV